MSTSDNERRDLPAHGGFGGKKAAPFKKGGGRSTKHPNTAKGQPRKK